MSKYEKQLTGNFSDFVRYMDEAITSGSMTATFEDGSDFSVENARIAVRVYERYSMIGGNRVSLNLTILGVGDQITVSAITSGGSQAMFFKINTFGEGAFLDACASAIDRYLSGN
ncbi:MAG: hypothetical protein JW780_00150 [Clostridiales bacterium]|nr:hypothetical protein [Clostridiales bacterium]